MVYSTYKIMYTTKDISLSPENITHQLDFVVVVYCNNELTYQYYREHYISTPTIHVVVVVPKIRSFMHEIPFTPIEFACVEGTSPSISWIEGPNDIFGMDALKMAMEIVYDTPAVYVWVAREYLIHNSEVYDAFVNMYTKYTNIEYVSMSQILNSAALSELVFDNPLYGTIYASCIALRNVDI